MKKAAVPSILVAVVLLAVGVTAEAQQPKKVSRIGYLSARTPQLVGKKCSLRIGGRGNRKSVV